MSKAQNHPLAPPSVLACILTFTILGISRGRDSGQAEEGGHKGGQHQEGEMGAHDDDDDEGLLCACVVFACSVVRRGEERDEPRPGE